jgi:ubiquinone/menaquinone biosynthesis C-methylase UbiE
MKHGPTRLEIFLTRLAFLLRGRSVYQAFAVRMPLKGGEQVLDFGCGMGTVAYYVASKLSQGHLTCLDISKRWLDACRKTLRRYRNVTYMSGAHMLSEESYDVIYCHFVLHDIAQDELERIIPTLARALKPGGRFFFREPLKESGKLNFIKRLMEKSMLIHEKSYITDVPVMGNTLDSVYVKGKGGSL